MSNQISRNTLHHVANTRPLDHSTTPTPRHSPSTPGEPTNHAAEGSQSSAKVSQLIADGDRIAFSLRNKLVGDATPVNAPAAGQQQGPTPASEKIKELVSYRWNDWFVTDNDQRQVVELLRNDPAINATIRDLESSGRLDDTIKRVDNPSYRRELIQILGTRLDDQTAESVKPVIADLDTYVASGLGGAVATGVNRNLWQVAFNSARLGVTPSNTPFDSSAYGDLISNDPSAAFSGVGATGRNPTELSVPLGDQWALLRGDEATTDRYSNPIPNSLSDYLDSVGPVDRRRQAELFLNQPISTTMPEIYGGNLPTRADVVEAAAAKYNLQPEVVAAFLLAEQRDQSQREDAKDYTAATSLRQANTSIGLGQVVISTAERNELFSDLIDTSTQRQLSHNDYARLLADDTMNIFASAKYIRNVADRAASAPPEVQARFRDYFPAVDFGKFQEHSANWPFDNIQALASEYTSAPWDLNPGQTPQFVDSPGWGYFVGEAYRDVGASGAFR